MNDFSWMSKRHLKVRVITNELCVFFPTPAPSTVFPGLNDKSSHPVSQAKHLQVLFSSPLSLMSYIMHQHNPACSIFKTYPESVYFSQSLLNHEFKSLLVIQNFVIALQPGLYFCFCLLEAISNLAAWGAVLKPKPDHATCLLKTTLSPSHLSKSTNQNHYNGLYALMT